MTPALSIILVARNAMPLVTRAIEIVAECARRLDAEVIAIDGQSDDGTWAALHAEPGWIVRRQLTLGLAPARNQALQLSRADLIAFHDADDQWLPGKLEKQLGRLHAEPETDVVSCLLRRVGEKASGDAQPAWTPTGCLFRRRAFERVGEFDPRYGIGCDHDWFVRAYRAEMRMTCIAECLMHKHIHQTNLSHSRGAYRNELFEILRSHE